VKKIWVKWEWVCYEHDPMSELSELLELLHNGETPFVTLCGRFRIWRHLERHEAAFRADALRRGGTTGRIGPDCPSSPEQSETVLCLWRATPDRARVEYRSGPRDGAYGVRVGEHWWSWDARHGTRSNAQDQSLGSETGKELSVLLDPPQCLSVFRFAPISRATRAGRPVIVVEAQPRPEPARVHGRYASVRHGLGTGADSYRLDIDAERGIVLASHAFFQGEPFQVIEALEIVLDEPLDKGLFEFQSPEDDP
jgi:hypothetical protein